MLVAAALTAIAGLPLGVVQAHAQDTAATPPPIFHLHAPGYFAQQGRVALAKELLVSLRIPSGQDFSQANVGRVVLRTAKASQHSIYPSSGATPTELRFTPTVPGPALLMTCAGDSTDQVGKRSVENNRYCSKIIFSVDGSTDYALERRSHAIVTAKVGGAVELLPLESPLLKHAGDTMWLRAYLLNDIQRGRNIDVFGPQGEYASYQTNNGGNAQIQLSSSGTWTVRYEAQHHGETYIAELSFFVADAEVAQ